MKRSFLAGMLLLLAGCLSLQPKPDPTQFFLLTPAPASQGVSAGPTIGLHRVTVPDYLDQSQLVRRVGPDQVEFLPMARWAEPLATQVTRDPRERPCRGRRSRRGGGVSVGAEPDSFVRGLRVGAAVRARGGFGAARGDVSAGGQHGRDPPCAARVKRHGGGRLRASGGDGVGDEPGACAIGQGDRLWTRAGR